MSLLEETLKHGSLLLALQERKIKRKEVFAYILESKRSLLPLALFFIEAKRIEGEWPPFFRFLEELSKEDLSLENITSNSAELDKEELDLACQAFSYYSGLYCSSPNLAKPSLILCARDIELVEAQRIPSSACIEYDLLDHLAQPSREEFLTILERLKFLSSQAPLYYKEVAFPYYRRFLQSQDLYYCIAKEFSALGLVELEKSPLQHNLSLLSSQLRNYILGVPLKESYKVPFSVEEIEKHQEEVRRRNLARLPSLNYLGQSLQYTNTEDSLYNDVYSYSSEDIACLIQDNHCFLFTRPEFSLLVEKGKNFYTGEDLPEFFIRDIASRSIYYLLDIQPFLPCTGKPVREMLEALEKL